MRITGVIQAGGRSMRMGGRPKALMELGGRRIIDRVADVVRAVADDLLIVTNTPELYASLGLPMVPDAFPDHGSLGGIYSGLSAAAGDAAFTVACDMPFLMPEVARLVTGAGRRRPTWWSRGSASSGRRSTPATARRCLGADRDAAPRRAAQDRRLLRRGARARDLGEDEVARYRAPEVVFMNVNTPEDLEAARGLLPALEPGPRRQVPLGAARAMDARVEGLGLGSIQEINALPREVAEALYARLVPEELLDRFAIDPATLCDKDGARLVRVTAPADKPWARVEVRAVARRTAIPRCWWTWRCRRCRCRSWPSCRSPTPRAPRYAIDRDPDGRDTLFGTASRNVDEERRAMQDGLAPGQVRRGLRLLSRVLDAMEGFCALIGKEIYLIEPLFYHSAILYERRGCGYLMGRDVMEEIHAGFAGRRPAARGARRLLRTSAAPEAARTVRGPELGPPRRRRRRALGRRGGGRGEDVQGGRPAGGHQHLPGRALLTGTAGYTAG